MDYIKTLIKHAEDRMIDYKKQLEEIGKNKELRQCEDVAWYKEILRELKNSDESWLKKLIEEKRYFNEGMNPPFMYNKLSINLKK